MLSEGVNKIIKKKIIGVSATKSWEKARIFRYELSKDFLIEGQKKPPWLRGLREIEGGKQ